jgi:cytochrome b561
MMRNSRERWGRAARWLHWSVALLVLAQVPLGWAAKAWRLSPLKLELFVWHKSIGFVVLALMLLRLAWRLFDAAPARPRGEAPWSRRAAAGVHGLLYAVLFALPVTGWVVNSAANVPFRIFWRIPVPAIVAPDKALAEAAAQAHFALVVTLAVLLALHVGAALWHHFVRRDGVLHRMYGGPPSDRERPA